MKKIILSLSVATLLLDTPNAQAAFIPRSVERVVTSGISTTAAAEILNPTSSETAIHSQTLFKAKKLSFFGKLKIFFTPAVGRNQVLAALLAFFLGSFGIHRIYLGYSGIAAVQICLLLLGLALSFLVSGAGVLGIVLLMVQTLWGLIDFIRILAGELKPKGSTYEKTKRKEPLWEEED